MSIGSLCICKEDNKWQLCNLALYVDDMLVAGSSMQDIVDLKKKLENTFEMKDLGEAKQILRMKITRDK